MNQTSKDQENSVPQVSTYQNRGLKETTMQLKTLCRTSEINKWAEKAGCADDII